MSSNWEGHLLSIGVHAKARRSNAVTATRPRGPVAISVGPDELWGDGAWESGEGSDTQPPLGVLTAHRITMQSREENDRCSSMPSNT